MSTKLVKLHDAFPARIAHPANVSCIPPMSSSTRELEGSITNLINRLQMETSVRSQRHREVVQEITQLNKDQDVKTNDHVSRIQGVLHSLAVKVRDDAGFVTEARSDPQPHDSDHGKPSIRSRQTRSRRPEDLSV